MTGVNKVILVGRLGKDPEVKNLSNGNAVANFSIATSETWKDKTTGEKKEATEWHNIVLWGRLAEVAQQYVHKGDLIYIEGKLRTRSWEQDGVRRYMTEVVADTMNMLGSRGNGSAPAAHNGPASYAAAAAPSNYNAAPAGNTTSDDLPF